jgi:hypothetical protein
MIFTGRVGPQVGLAKSCALPGNVGTRFGTMSLACADEVIE